MKSFFRVLPACALALTTQFALAAATPTNAPTQASAPTRAPAVASTNAGARILTARSELREINNKLRELQTQCTNAPAVQTIMGEYEATRQELQAVNKKLQDIQQRLQDAVVAEIVKRDPSAQKLIDRRQELMNEIKAAHPPMTMTPRASVPGGAPMPASSGTKTAPAVSTAPAPAEQK